MSVPARLHLSQIPELDRLTALELGRVDEGQPSDAWRPVSEQVGLLTDEDGRDVGFCVLELSGYDPDHPDHAPLWDGPRFAVPALGLPAASPNEVVVACRALYGDAPTVNRTLFTRAVGATGQTGLRRWLACLQAGDSMAHYGLGYTLFQMGRLHEAYRHLRHYAEIAPQEAWAWTWRGKAAAAVGELGEARAAYVRAIDIGGDDTDAEDLLDLLDCGVVEQPRRERDVSPLAELLEELEFEHAVDDHLAPFHVVFDAGPRPVFLTVGGLDAAQLAAQVGSLPGVAGSDALGAELARVVTAAEDRILEGDGIWVRVGIETAVEDVGPRALAALVEGVAARAQRVAGALADDPGLGPLVAPPPTYDDVTADGE